MRVNPKHLLGAALFASLALTAPVGAQTAEDTQAVRQAALDYVNAIYNVEPELIRRSVHPTLRKIGYWRPDESTPYRELNMNFDQLVRLAGSWNADGTNAGSDAVKNVEVHEVLDMTASAKLTAVWGIDYMQMAKIDGRWMIMNIVWQSPPPGT